MKICWDNLEKLEYRPDRGEWQDKKWKNMFYIYKNACKNCGESFLALFGYNSKQLFCSNFCYLTDDKYRSNHSQKVSGKNHYLWGKKNQEHSERMKDKNNSNWHNGGKTAFFDTYASQISFCEDVRRNKNDINVLEVKCTYCGKWYIPTRNAVSNRIQALNGEMGNGTEMRFYCSTKCKKECPIFRKVKFQVGHPKSNKSEYSREVQPELRQMCFERDEFICQKCGLTQDELDVGLHCHHYEGIRWEPLESADLDNVITFCKICHKEVHKQTDCGYHDMRCK